MMEAIYICFSCGKEIEGELTISNGHCFHKKCWLLLKENEKNKLKEVNNGKVNDGMVRGQE